MLPDPQAPERPVWGVDAEEMGQERAEPVMQAALRLFLSH